MACQTINLRIERKQDVLDKMRFSRSTLYLRIQQGLFVPPISLGSRAVGWLEHETDLVLSGLISGKNEDEIRAIVQELIADRAVLYSSNRCQYTRSLGINSQSEVGK